MKILLTGASGMVGRFLLPRLASRHQVFAISRSEGQPLEAEGVEWVTQDLSRPLDPRGLPAEIDAVAHLAQSRRYRDFPEGAEDIFAVNVQSTFRLLEYARGAGARSFLLASTGGLYQYSEEPIAEDAPPVPTAPYFRSKRIAELLLDDYADQLATSVLRFFFVYGPGPGRTLIPRFAERILGGEEVVVDGDPGLRINPIYVEDAAAAIEAALGLETGVLVNIAGEEVVSITELTRRLAAALGRDPRLRHSAGGPPGDLVADTSRMHEVLGVTATTSLDRGLAEVARWFATRRSTAHA